jgi:hypothetical protein
MKEKNKRCYLCKVGTVYMDMHETYIILLKYKSLSIVKYKT